MKRVLAILGVACLTLTAQAQLPRDPAETARAVWQQKDAALQQPHALAACVGAMSITPPTTIHGTIQSSTCVDEIGLREDVYIFAVTAGQTLDIDYSSTAFETFLFVSKGSTSFPVNDVSSLNPGGTSRVTLHTTFTSAGSVKIEAESLFSMDPVGAQPWSGAYTLVVTLTGSTTPIPTPTANTQIVPIVGHVTGAGGSAFRSDLKLYNGSSSTVTGRLVFTPRNQSRSASDPSVAFNVPPFGVRFYEDVYLLAYPGGSGAARLTIVPDTTTSSLVVDTSTYTANPDGGELAQSPTVSVTADYYASGKKLVGLLGKGSERSNVFVMTGSTDVTIQWRLRDSNGVGSQTFTKSYAKDSTFQLSVSDITGAPPPPNASLEATIQSGSARVALSPVNNVSNQGRWADFKVAP
ncbi:MAG TPA: hypothetical protein VN605_07805 [Thermoanaerobaculia bacterium]|nr:hypothetical protein [Thermoanaerobaculia bacterium]